MAPRRVAARVTPATIPARHVGSLWRDSAVDRWSGGGAREARRLDEMARYLGWPWDDTVDGANLVHRSATAAGVGHTSRPEVWWVEAGPPLTLIVRMLPGQVVAAFEAQAHRTAERMGVPMVPISSHRHGWLRVAFLVPLTDPMPLPPRPAGTSAAVPVLLGADEYGRPVTVDFGERCT